jgi:hypothetical protein
MHPVSLIYGNILMKLNVYMLERTIIKGEGMDMKLQKTSLMTETACKAKRCESVADGRLSLPAGKADIERVLLVQGGVHMNTEPAEGRVFMEGTVRFSVVYVDVEGNIDAFESASPFRHSENVENASVGMNVFAKGNMREIEHTLEDKRTLFVRGIVSIRLQGDITTPVEAVSGADAPEVQVKMTNKRMMNTKEVRKETMALREDIRVPQSMPRAEKILSSEAYPVVRSVRAEDMKLIVEGEIKLMVLYLSEDKAAPLQNFYESLPFGQIFPMENAAQNDMMTGDAELYDMNVEIADDASDILRMSAKVLIFCTVKKASETELMEDAYSTKNKIDVVTEKRACRCLAVSGCAKAIARSTVTVPETYPAVSRVICMKASPMISAATPGIDRVYIEGLMMFSVCYASPQGLWSYSGETPFEAEAQMEGIKADHDVEVSADVEYCAFEGAGRDLSVKFMMDVEIKAYTENEFSVVSDVKETEEKRQIKKGITIYFADGTESVWDIAKRYATTPDTVKKFNPNMADTVSAGQKVLIMG